MQFPKTKVNARIVSTFWLKCFSFIVSKMQATNFDNTNLKRTRSISVGMVVRVPHLPKCLGSLDTSEYALVFKLFSWNEAYYRVTLCQVHHLLCFLKKRESKLFLIFFVKKVPVLIPIGLYPIKLNFPDRQNGLGLQGLDLSVWWPIDYKDHETV